MRIHDRHSSANAFRRALVGLLVWFALLSGAVAVEPCRIQIVDDENGWPVPLVELRTTHHVRFISDNRGQIAFDLPELMGVETWFDVKGHGYSVAPDGFGEVGIRLVPAPGVTHVVRVKRSLPAKRLGRITGGGLFAESQQLGDALNWEEQKILGCDSVQNAIHNGRLFWAWGDTMHAGYPLGSYHMIGATTQLKPLESFRPPIELRYDYIRNAAGVPRDIAKMPGNGPTWLSGCVSLPDSSGKQRLVATYAKIKPPVAEYERGLCVWNEPDSRFERHKVLWQRSEQKSRPTLAPGGHAVLYTDEDNQQWVLFGDPFPTLRCRATFEDWSEPEKWETLKPQEYVMAANSKERIKPHRGAIGWSAYKKKWVSIFTQFGGGPSHLGEIWYAEAEQPTGPWTDAIKVVTHDKYTFYNPQLHLEFTPHGSPILLFEATYTYTFSKTRTPTPRHDYNQVLYRLDLDTLPVE